MATDLGVDVIGAPGVAEGLGVEAVSEEAAECVRVESGRPRLGLDMGGDTIPQEAGLNERAVNFEKGCYVGQEVIVRVIDRGHGRVARRLVGLTLPGDAAVPAARAVLTSGSKEIGRVTSAVFSPALARPIALGYVQRDFVAPGTVVHVADSGDATITALPLVPLQ